MDALDRAIRDELAAALCTIRTTAADETALSAFTSATKQAKLLNAREAREFYEVLLRRAYVDRKRPRAAGVYYAQ